MKIVIQTNEELVAHKIVASLVSSLSNHQREEPEVLKSVFNLLSKDDGIYKGLLMKRYNITHIA